MTPRELIAELAATTCQCGQPKKAHRSLCGTCYFRLPPPMRRALYALVGDGYAEARDAAVIFLAPEATAAGEST